MIVEPHADQMPTTTAAARQIESQNCSNLASRNPLTRRIEEIIIRDEPLPVDIRHNSKIFREQLAAELHG